MATFLTGNVIITKASAFQRLREKCLQSSTKEFRARGAYLKRCPHCLLGETFCICEFKKAQQGSVDFILLLHSKEVYKPTNTGRLIADIFPDNTHAYIWSRTQPDSAFLEMLSDPTRECVISFPHSSNMTQPVWQDTKSGNSTRRLSVIIPDGSWRQAGRMVRLSPYLANIPVMEMASITGEYSVRKAPFAGQLSTAEAAVALLEQLGEGTAAQALANYFFAFNKNYPLSRGR